MSAPSILLCPRIIRGAKVDFADISNLARKSNSVVDEKEKRSLKVKSLDFKLPDSRRITFEEMGVFFGGDGEILKQEHRETFCPEFQQ